MPRTLVGQGLVSLVVAATCFSWGFVIVKGLPLAPPVVAFYRLVLGAVLLSLAAWILRVPWPARPAAVIGAGLAFGVHQLLYIHALQLTTIAVVALMSALTPLVIALVSRRAVGEHVPRVLFGYALVAVLGAALVVWAGGAGGERHWAGDALAVANLLVFTAFFLFSKRARQQGAPALTLTAASLAIALVVVTPAALAVGIPLLSGEQLGLLLVLVLGPGNGHLLVNWAHAHISAALASMILSLVPLLASVWAHLVFDEPLTWLHGAGIALVVIAVEGGRRAASRP